MCRALGITKRTLQTYREKGIVPFTSVGGKYFYREDDVATWLASKTRPVAGGLAEKTESGAGHPAARREPMADGLATRTEPAAAKREPAVAVAAQPERR